MKSSSHFRPRSGSQHHQMEGRMVQPKGKSRKAPPFQLTSGTPFASEKEEGNPHNQSKRIADSAIAYGPELNDEHGGGGGASALAGGISSGLTATSLPLVTGGAVSSPLVGLLALGGALETTYLYQGLTSSFGKIDNSRVTKIPETESHTPLKSYPEARPIFHEPSEPDPHFISGNGAPVIGPVARPSDRPESQFPLGSSGEIVTSVQPKPLTPSGPRPSNRPVPLMPSPEYIPSDSPEPTVDLDPVYESSDPDYYDDYDDFVNQDFFYSPHHSIKDDSIQNLSLIELEELIKGLVSDSRFTDAVDAICAYYGWNRDLFNVEVKRMQPKGRANSNVDGNISGVEINIDLFFGEFADLVATIGHEYQHVLGYNRRKVPNPLESEYIAYHWEVFVADIPSSLEQRVDAARKALSILDRLSEALNRKYKSERKDLEEFINSSGLTFTEEENKAFAAEVKLDYPDSMAKEISYP